MQQRYARPGRFPSSQAASRRADPSSREEDDPLSEIVGTSRAVREIRTKLRLYAPLATSVLLLGETGTGKGLAARVLHELSGRQGDFVHVNCATVSPSLADSHLFGHERGAFTSARDRRIGAVERADGGTLFLDELTELPVELQAKLLTVLDDGCYERVGGSETRQSNFRLVAATAADLGEMLDKGTLRGDLYYRIKTALIRLPSLVRRGHDAVLLSRELVPRLVREIGCGPVALTPLAEARLLGREWPGNIRQLKGVLTSAIIHAEDGIVNEAIMDQAIGNDEESSRRPSRWLSTLDEALANAKREHILRALAATDGNKELAAKLLGISTRTLFRYRKELGIE